MRNRSSNLPFLFFALATLALGCVGPEVKGPTQRLDVQTGNVIFQLPDAARFSVKGSGFSDREGTSVGRIVEASGRNEREILTQYLEKYCEGYKYTIEEAKAEAVSKCQVKQYHLDINGNERYISLIQAPEVYIFLGNSGRTAPRQNWADARFIAETLKKTAP